MRKHYTLSLKVITDIEDKDELEDRIMRALNSAPEVPYLDYADVQLEPIEGEDED